MNEDKKRLRACQVLNSNWWRPISTLDFAYASANHRPEPKSGERVSQLAAWIQKMSHEMSEPFETLPFFPDFNYTLLAPASSHSSFPILLSLISKIYIITLSISSSK